MLMRIRQTIALIGIPFVLSACVTAAAAGRAATECGSQGLQLAQRYGANARPVGAFDLSAAQMAAYQERGPQAAGATPAPHVVTSSWRRRPATEHVSMCFYDGTFDKFSLRAGPGSTPPPVPDRIVILVDASGNAGLVQAGPSSGIPVRDPTVP